MEKTCDRKEMLIDAAEFIVANYVPTIKSDRKIRYWQRGNYLSRETLSTEEVIDDFLKNRKDNL